MAPPSPFIFQELQHRLASFRRKQLRVEFQFSFFLFVTFTLVSIAIGAVAEALFLFASLGRTVLALGLSLFVLSLFLWLIVRPALRLVGALSTTSDFQLAEAIGSFFPLIRDRLLNLLQLHEESKRGTLYSAELIDASFNDLATVISPLNFLDAIDRSRVKRTLHYVGIAVASTVFLTLVFPQAITGALHRLAYYDQEFIPPPEFVFVVSPGDAEIVKGEAVPIAVTIRSARSRITIPSELRLRWRPEGQTSFEETLLLSDSSGYFESTFPALRFSTEYFAEYAGEESEHFRLTVIDRPVVRSFRIRLEYPSYTRLPARIQEEFVGDVKAVPGTRVFINGNANKDLKAGRIAFSGDSSIALAVRGADFSASFPFFTESAYHVTIVDLEGLTNPDPITFQLKIIPDESPTITLLDPGRNLDITGIASLPLRMMIRDDYGFSRLRLGYRLSHSRYEQISDQYTFTDLRLPRVPSPQAEIAETWDLSSLDLVPEDVIEYFCEILDNDPFSGPKSARTPLFLLRLPSLEEVFSDLNESHQVTLEDIAQGAQEAEELRERIASLEEDLKKNKDFDWQQQKKLEETVKRYQELQKNLHEVRDRLDSMVEQMQQQKILAPETMEKYLELQQLFEQLDSAELQNALKQMQQALQNVNREQLQQALRNVTFSEEQFRESLERTLNLLKRIQIEQKLDELRKRAEELSQSQETLWSESVEDSLRNADDLAKRQEDLVKKLRAMQDVSHDVQNRMEEFFTEMPEQELEEANRQLEQSDPAANMQKAAEQLRSKRRQSARQLQQQTIQGLQNFSSQLRAMQEQMLQQQQQYVVRELRKAANDLLELSKREESLKDRSKTAPQNSPLLRTNAQEQIEVLQNLASLIDGLNELAKRSFVVTPRMGKAIGEAYAHMQSAMKALDLRSGVMASQDQTNAMGALNKAAMEVQNTLQALLQQAGGQGGGLFGQLQTLAGQQMSINMRTQAMQEAARLAVEQEALRKSLEQLNREAQASGEQQRILGDLQKIADEMKEVIRNLEQNSVNPETIRKQEQILSRLLDAARSAREQDFEKKRKATTGTQIARKSPEDLDPETLEGKSRLQDDLLKALEQGYSKDYLELIRKYFDQLQKIDQ